MRDIIFAAIDNRKLHIDNADDEMQHGAANFPYLCLHFIAQLHYIFCAKNHGGRDHYLPELRGIFLPVSSSSTVLHPASEMQKASITEAVRPKHDLPLVARWGDLLVDVTRRARNFMMKAKIPKDTQPYLIYLTNDVALTGEEHCRSTVEASKAIKIFGKTVQEVLQDSTQRPLIIVIICVQISRYPGHVARNSHAIFFPCLRKELESCEGVTVQFILCPNASLHLDAEVRRFVQSVYRAVPCRIEFPLVGNTKVILWTQLQSPVLHSYGEDLPSSLVRPDIIGVLPRSHFSPCFTYKKVLVGSPYPLLSTTQQRWVHPDDEQLLGDHHLFAWEDCYQENLAGFKEFISTLARKDLLLVYRSVSSPPDNLRSLPQLREHWVIIPPSLEEIEEHNAMHYIAVNFADRENVIMPDPPPALQPKIKMPQLEDYFEGCMGIVEQMERLNPAEFSSGRLEQSIENLISYFKEDDTSADTVGMEKADDNDNDDDVFERRAVKFPKSSSGKPTPGAQLGVSMGARTASKSGTSSTHGHSSHQRARASLVKAKTKHSPQGIGLTALGGSKRAAADAGMAAQSVGAATRRHRPATAGTRSSAPLPWFTSDEPDENDVDDPEDEMDEMDTGAGAKLDL